MRRHPSYVTDGSYVIPEPRSHVNLIKPQSPSGKRELAQVVDLAEARARLRAAS